MRNDRAIDAVCWLLTGLVAIGFVIALNPQAWAETKDRSQWANSPNKSWYDNAQTTEAARQRLGFKSCCEKADVVKTKFKVNQTTNGDEWWYDNKGKWKQIPPDIIQATGTPDGQPVLFKVGETEACFFIGEGGI